MRNERVSRIVLIGFMGGLAFLLMYFAEFHIPPFASFLKYDPGDVPAVVMTSLLGPVAGVTVQAIKVLLFAISGKATDGFIGILANFLAGAALVLATALLQRLLGEPSWFKRLVTAVCGAVVMAVVLIPFLATVIFPLWGITGAAAWTAALTISTPFNLFKGFLSTLAGLMLYQRVRPAFNLTSFKAA